ncbi:hypothetical protein F7725_007655 [Dissostichus mawsoni]|uniref:Uncharacterized protein n=1 Tax=Dissostichus mawsoni TaxID=36200 RepID=A0A7J5Y508_DISMA|nr:hypothetical protein F7725_007655 [Dissostichus mawsoni]
MNAFVTKLTLFKDGFSADRPNLAHFPSCEEMRKDAPECEKTLPKYRADTETLQQQFKKRFQDFHTMQPRIELFTNPSLLQSSSSPLSCSLKCANYSQTPF